MSRRSTIFLRSTLWLFAALAAVSAVQAAEGAFVTATVTDAGGAPLQYAEAHLIRLDENYRAARRQLEASTLEVVARARCDAAGRFRLHVPAAGIYRVRVDAPGYLGARYQPLPLNVPSDADLELPTVALRLATDAIIEFHRETGGAPVGGAFVNVLSSRVGGGPALGRDSLDNGWRPSARSGRIGREGRLVVPVARGEWIDLAIVPPWSDQPRRILGVTGVRYFLDPGREASGVLVVQDAQGQALPDVVALLGAEGIAIGSTDQHGRLEVRGDFTEPEPLKLFDATGRRFSGWWVTPPPGVEVARQLPNAERVTGVASSIARAKATDPPPPLRGALVWSNRDPGRFTTTADAGRFALTLPPESGALWLEGRAVGHLPAHFEAERASQWRGQTLDLVFETSAMLHGVVVDGAGHPLPGVDLRLDSDVAWPSFALDRAAGRGVTDAFGRFAIAPLWGAMTHVLDARKLGFTDERMEVDPAQLASPLRLVLDDQKAAFGWVVDVDERPIAGAEVRVTSSGARRSRPRSTDGSDDPFIGITNEDGRFELAALPASRIDIKVERQGFAPMSVRGIDVSPQASSVDLGTLLMEHGRSVLGIVVDSAGEPVPEASVWRVERVSPSLRHQLETLRGHTPETSSDVDGLFRLDDLPAATRLDLVVHRFGYRPVAVEGVEVGTTVSEGSGAAGPGANRTEDHIEVVLRPASTVSGRVLDEAGDAIVDAGVSLDPHVMETGSLAPTTLDGDDQQSTSTDAEGRFRFDVVTPGTYSAVASSNAHQTAPALTLDVEAEASHDDVDFVLEEGVVLSGFALTEEGEPLRGVRVVAGDTYGMSDAAGRFEVLGITPGTHEVEGRYEGLPRVRKVVDIALDGAEIDLVFALGIEVEGRVTDAGGGAVGGVWVSISGGDLFAEYSDTTDGDGRFSLEGVGAGDYRLRARRRGFAEYDEENALRLGDVAKRDVRVVLDDAGAIIGQLTGLEYEDLERVVVSAQLGRRHAQAEVDFEGRYRLDDLSRGDWLVHAEVPGTGREAEARVPLAAGEQATQDLDFASGFALSGSVAWNGSPLPATLIAVRGLDAALVRQARSNHQGEFRFENLRPGRYRLDASNPKELLTQNLDIRLESDREVAIEFDTAKVSGWVLSEDDGQPLGEAMVVLRRQLQDTDEPGSMSSVGTRSDGSFEFGRLAKGSYRLNVQRDGFVPHTEDVEVSGDVGPLELTLSSATGLDLVVRRRDGSVPPFVYVSVLDADGQPQRVEGRDLAADGSVRLPNLGAGVWRLWLAAPGAVPSTLDVEVPTEAPVAVELETAGQVVVRVDSLVRTSAVASLQLIGPDGAPWRTYNADTGTPQDAWRMSAGVAHVDGVPAGQWLVRVETPSGALWESVAATSGVGVTRVSLE